MTWVRVWTLKRGKIDPPEPISEQDARLVESAPYRESLKAKADWERKQVQNWMECEHEEIFKVRTLYTRVNRAVSHVGS